MTMMVLVAALFLWLGVGCTVRAQTPAPAIHEAHASINGARIFYIDTGGAGTPVVFLHANTGSSRVWENQIPAFTAAGYRFIAFDRRGWGRTEVDSRGAAEPPPPTTYWACSISWESSASI